MTRISKLPLEQIDPEIREIMAGSDEIFGGSEWIQVFAHTPELYKALTRFYQGHIMTDGDGISLKLTELVRRKVALHNDCHLCQSVVYASARQQGVTDELIEALRDFEGSDLFTAREKAALRYADRMAGDHRKISDDLFEELREHFSEREIMALGWRIALFIGYGRLIYSVGLEGVGRACTLER